MEKNKQTSAEEIEPVANKFLTEADYIPLTKEERKARRKHLDERLRAMNYRTQIIERELQKLESRYYRTCIFGSARIKSDSPIYKDVEELARLLAGVGIDILTGGGPGLMEAANKGAQVGKKETKTKSRSYGLSIQLDFEPVPNSHLDVKRHHHKFSSRLDDFMRLSNSVIITPGGIGSLLELLFTWQLIQVKHLPPRPIVLMDSVFWNGFLQWMKDFPTARKLVGPGDFDCLSIVDTPEQVFEIIQTHYESFLKEQSKENSKNSTAPAKKPAAKPRGSGA